MSDMRDLKSLRKLGLIPIINSFFRYNFLHPVHFRGKKPNATLIARDLYISLPQIHGTYKPTSFEAYGRRWFQFCFKHVMAGNLIDTYEGPPLVAWEDTYPRSSKADSQEASWWDQHLGNNVAFGFGNKSGGY